MTSELVQIETSPNNTLPDMWSSINGGTREERLAIFDAISNCGSLEDQEGTIINLENVIFQQVEMENDDGDTVDATRIVVIDDKGKAYGCVSSGVHTALKNLFGCMGVPPYDPAIPLLVEKKQGRGKYKFTTLSYVK